jgi:hypothetical protein
LPNVFIDSRFFTGRNTNATKGRLSIFTLRPLAAA